MPPRSDRERTVIASYFLQDLTQAQIGERIGVSQMQVSRILRRALERLSEQAPPDAPSGHRSADPEA